MKANAIVLIGLLLLNNIICSQTISINTSTIVPDTTWPASSEQINLSNNIYNDLDNCIVLLDSAYSSLKTCEELQKKAAERFKTDSIAIDNYSRQLSNTTTLLINSEIKVANSEKKIGRLKTFRNVLIGVATVETVFIVIDQLFRH